MTRAERQAIKKEAHWRVVRAFSIAQKLSGDTRLWKKIACLLLTLSTWELSRLK
jgi:hypothetical protein